MSAILDSHYPTTSNVILTSHGFPAGPMSNTILDSHGDPYTGPGGGGSLTHGASFVLTGSGFGTRAATPLVYDNFETGTVGANIAGNAPTMRGIGGSWTWTDSCSDSVNYRPKYSTDFLRGPSSRSSRHQYAEPNGYRTALEIIKDITATGDEVYFSFWRYHDRTSGTHSRNIKPWMEYGTRGGDAPNAYVGWGDLTNPELRGISIDGVSDGGTIWGSHNVTAAEGQWIRMEVYLKQSSSSAADGAFQVWVHQANTPSITLDLNDTSYQTRFTSDYWTQWLFGCYHAVDTPSTAAGSSYLDQIYFDTTRQRVELGNASTWAACTRRELQPSTAWSNTSITILAQKGLISSGTAWLYVIGADGNPIDTNGTAVTVA